MEGKGPASTPCAGSAGREGLSPKEAVGGETGFSAPLLRPRGKADSRGAPSLEGSITALPFSSFSNVFLGSQRQQVFGAHSAARLSWREGGRGRRGGGSANERWGCVLHFSSSFNPIWNAVYTKKVTAQGEGLSLPFPALEQGAVLPGL